jgi:hypothetical protein
MALREDLNITGRLILRKWSLDGQLLQEVTAHNDITTDGRRLVARLFDMDKQGTNIERVSSIHVGISNDPFDPAQHGLKADLGQTVIKQIDLVDVLPRQLLRLTGELGEDDCNGALREAGLFTSDGVMYNRVTFDTITKSTEFKLTLIWEITF